jgi:serine/threonine protein kinase
MRELLTQWNMSLSLEVIDLMQGMLKADPNHRLSLEEIASHPWMMSTQELPAPVPPAHTATPLTPPQPPTPATHRPT